MHAPGVGVTVVDIRIDFPWKMQGSTTLPSSDEICQCLGDSTDASFIELQRAGGPDPAP